MPGNRVACASMKQCGCPEKFLFSQLKTTLFGFGDFNFGLFFQLGNIFFELLVA